MESTSWLTAKTAAAICAAAVVLGGAAGRGQAQGPAGAVRVWTSDAASDEQAASAGGTLGTVSIVAARNGAFSGKVVVESAGAVKGLRASVGAIARQGAPAGGPAAAIPARNVQLRYALAWENRGWGWPGGPDILLESPPAEVPPPNRGRAFAPVWITVKVPKDAKAGTYAGELAVQAQGVGPVQVPLKLDVQDWTLPDPQDYRTWLDLIQSPDTLALEYKTPLWSQKHWDLIDRSFRLISDTGSRVLYVPLICRTNFGNEESMVRWVKKPSDRPPSATTQPLELGTGGQTQYEYDFTVMDKYLDSAQKNMGKPKLVIFLVWDVCMSQASLTRGLWGGDNETRQGRQELLGRGPRVTAVEAATGERQMAFLPRYQDPASKALWLPLWTEIRKRMERRGLEKTMMLGVCADLWPSKEDVTFLKDVTGGLPWASHAHAGSPSDTVPGNKLLYKTADLGYAAHVYNLCFNVNPAKGRLYGWRNPGLVAHFPRGGDLNMSPCLEIRHLLEFNITGGQKGAGRIGADLWPAIRDRKLQRAGAAYHRYPENNWRNLDIGSWFLAPGPEGALSTARCENLREGAQECEARIFLEDTLLDAGKKAQVGAELAQRCQDLLDEHHRAMWKTVWSNDEDLDSVGKATAGRNPVEGFWMALEKGGKKLPGFWDAAARTMRSTEARKGCEWWFASGWQERNKKLFALAGEVAGKLGQK